MIGREALLAVNYFPLIDRHLNGKRVTFKYIQRNEVSDEIKLLLRMQIFFEKFHVLNIFDGVNKLGGVSHFPPPR